MTIAPLTRAAVRDVDRRAIEDYGLPGIVLMENAGRGAAEWLVSLGIAGRVVICAGKGNNGGDGYVIARHLELRGYQTRVLLFCESEELTGDAAINYRVLQAAGSAGRVMSGIPDLAALRQELSRADWVVDALLGTGTRGTLREPYLSTIAEINQARAAGSKIFAVDLPSGMDCDTGETLGACVHADYTATFVARKVGFDAVAASQFTGEIRVIDIGVPLQLLLKIEADCELK